MDLVICIHNHQPVGNMDFVLQKAYESSYLPFFEVLKDFEDVKISLHLSGYLLLWLKEHKPEFINLLNELKSRGQIEFIGGAMYEPVLSLIPEDDGVAQIRQHLGYIEELFSTTPKGIWLAERVYEPYMPRVLSKAGILYTILDDNHFKAIGMNEHELYRYFITEFDGYPLMLFPGLEFLRYAIPFKQIKDIDQYLKQVKEKGGSLCVFGDDGEKFGLWPGTFDHVYKGGWLKEFFTYLTDNRAWFNTVTFSEHIARHPASGPVYLNCNSYREMGQWCLPANMALRYEEYLDSSDDMIKPFLKGGYFKYFLMKYEEGNDIHKRMLSVSKKAKRDSEARRHVFMAQCNDCYWHGVFGGLYLPHLRSSAYRHLIKAEAILERKSAFVEGKLEDANMDGAEEAILNSNTIKAYFLLKEGGIMYELDYKPSSVNIMATLKRRYEAYHEKLRLALSPEAADGTKTIHEIVLTKEEELDRYLHYDWYRRGSLIDHVMGMDVDMDAFYKSTYREPGDFVKEPYKGVIEKEKDSVKLVMMRDGRYLANEVEVPLTIKKELTLKKAEDSLYGYYVIDGEVEHPFIFGVEFNLSFLGTGGERYMEVDGRRLPLNLKDILSPSNKVRFYDPYQDIEVSLEFEREPKLWTHPVEVVSLSEYGFERNYQSTMFMPVWTVDLREGPFEARFRLSLNKTPH